MELAGATFGVPTLVSRCYGHANPLELHTVFTLSIDNSIASTISQMAERSAAYRGVSSHPLLRASHRWVQRVGGI